MKRSTYRHYNLSQSNRSDFTISSFKGVDYSSQKFLIDNNRAIDLLNYIYKDGCIQKRNGVEAIACIKDFKYIAFEDETFKVKTNPNKFNGIWKFTAEDKKVHIIAHIGKLLFEIKNINSLDVTIEPFVIEQVTGENNLLYDCCYEFLNEQTSAFVNANKLWFFGGTKYMCIRFIDDDNYGLLEVENSGFASIPTTTISITYNDSIAGGHRAALDKVNLLTQWRKNKLLSGTGKNEHIEVPTKYYEYVLDAPIVAKNEEDLLKIILELETQGIYHVENDTAQKFAFSGISKTKWNAIKCTEDYNPSKEKHIETGITQEQYDLIKDKYIFAHLEPPEDLPKPFSLVKPSVSLLDKPIDLTLPDANSVVTIPGLFKGSIIGYLDDINDPNTNARVILFNDYKPPYDGVNNITITFPCYEKGNADKINKCRFGINFGSNNLHNRLFVSGNKDYPNCDWYSGVISGDEESIKGNFGYFEDTSENYYGSTENAVVGYDIISNNKLLVLKNKNQKEKTIYFRTPQLVEAIDAVGNSLLDLKGNNLTQEEFARIEGNNSVAGVSFKSITNFNGDTLFVSSEKKLVGLDLEGIIGDNQRYANSRSIYIDNELKKIDLNKVWLWSNNEYLFIVLEDKIFITHYQTRIDNQYEWWVVNIDHITSILEFEDNLYFGNEYGELYQLTNGYIDIKKIFLDKGEIYLNQDKIHVTSEIISRIKGAKKIFLNLTYKSNFAQEIASIGNEIKNCDLFIREELNCLENTCYDENGKVNFAKQIKVLSMLGEKNVVYIDNSNDYYTIEKITKDSTTLLYDCFKLFDKENNEVDIKNLTQKSIKRRLDGRYEIVNINEKDATFQIKDNDQIIDLVKLDQENTDIYVAQIEIQTPVEAFYITKPFTFGSLNYFKTIWCFTLTNDTNIPSELEVGIANNKIPYEKTKTLSKTSKEELGLDLDDINFNKIDFDKNIVPRTYTNQRIISQLKFISFVFKNYNPTNSVLSSMSILYTIPFPSYGGD